MTKFIPTVLLVAVLAAPVAAGAACDKVKAQEMVKVIEASGLAERQTDDMATYYFWKTGWYQMDYEQQYKMIQGLTGVEACLQDKFKATLIIFLGDVVARGTPGFNGPSAEVLKSRPQEGRNFEAPALAKACRGGCSWEGKTVVADGRAASVSLDGWPMFIVLEGGLICRLDSDAAEEAAGAERQNSVSVIGVVRTERGKVFLRGCRVYVGDRDR